MHVLSSSLFIYRCCGILFQKMTGLLKHDSFIDVYVLVSCLFCVAIIFMVTTDDNQRSLPIKT